MRVRIHRGAHEIGGSCMEVEHDGAVLVLDVGRPLDAERGEHVPLPQVDGLGGGDGNVVGLVISHSHQDHWGLVDQVHADVPLYIGERAASVLRAASFWGSGVDLSPAGFLQHRTPFDVGPFTVTPYLNDHSAFDAYSLLVEAGGERLFYSGDIRGHGRKGAIFESLVEHPPRGIDAMLLEGTNLRPGLDGPAPASLSESVVEDELVSTLRGTEGLAVVVSSAQNIDRLVTVFRAAKRSGRLLAMDAYTADVARATLTASIPRPDPEWTDVRVYIPQRQRVRIKESGEFERAAELKPYRVFAEDLTARPGGFVLIGALQGEVHGLLRQGVLTGDGCVVWSLWHGYLEDGSGASLRSALEQAGVPLVEHHTSGHASVGDLRRLVAALQPAALVPIHTMAPDGYGVIAGDVPVRQVTDGQWWNVRSAAATEAE